MAEEIATLEQRLVFHDREIRRLRARMDYLATGDGLRAIRIVGIVPPENLPSSALLAYVSFGSEPINGQTAATATIYAADMLVQAT